MPSQDDDEAARRSDAARLAALESKLDARRPATGPASAGLGHSLSQADYAWRMVIELVAGLMIGFGIGYGLDWLFGTRPILLVVFIFLGLAAGMKTMMGTARELAARQQKAGLGTVGGSVAADDDDDDEDEGH